MPPSFWFWISTPSSICLVCTFLVFFLLNRIPHKATSKWGDLDQVMARKLFQHWGWVRMSFSKNNREGVKWRFTHYKPTLCPLRLIQNIKIFQQHTYAIHLGLNKHQKKFQLIPNILRGPSSLLKIWAKLQRKMLLISVWIFEPLHFFKLNFHGWLTFFLIFL